MTLVTFGDSVTAPRGGVDVFTDRLSRALPDIRPINAGVGGNTTALARERFERDVLAHEPASAALCGVAMLGLAGLTRRRRA